MMYYGYGGNWIGAIVMMVFMALIMAGIVVAIVYALRAIGRDSQRGATGSGDDPALATLRERYARGEIDESEYQRRRQLLTQH